MKFFIKTFTFHISNGNIGGIFLPKKSDNTSLQETLLMNNTLCGATHYDIHVDMKLDYTKSIIFQKISLFKLETLHHLCEIQRTQRLKSLTLAVLRLPYAG